MSKKILMFIAAVLLVGMSIPAFAAVENVKVGGDITIRGIYRTDYDFTKDAIAKDSAGWLMTTTRVYVSSELTDNVAAVVRLINERDWGADGFSENIDIAGDGDLDVIQRRSGSGIDLDLAYIKLSDMFAPGLSATIGRQEILLGKGLMVGSRNSRDLGGIGAIRAQDYNARKAFDAIRLDYALSVIPLTLTGALAKINENYNAIAPPDRLGDTSLSVINANYQVPVADAEVEGTSLITRFPIPPRIQPMSRILTPLACAVVTTLPRFPVFPIRENWLSRMVKQACFSLFSLAPMSRPRVHLWMEALTMLSRTLPGYRKLAQTILLTPEMTWLPTLKIKVGLCFTRMV